MEKGHAKIVESLFKLIAFLQTLDPAIYNPPNPNLTIASLQALYAAAQHAIASVSSARENWRTKAKARALELVKLPELATSLVALFESLGVDKERVEQARSILRKIRGERATPAVVDDPDTPEDESEKSISASQQSAAQVVAAFRQLVDFLTAQPEYALVTDEGLRIADLTPLADSVEDKHEASIIAAAALSSQRSARDNLLYDDAACACERGALVKQYVKGKYGANSDEYKTVNAISFERAGSSY